MSKFESPFIFKIRFYKPEGDNPSKNAAHIKYIGTRPGVAIDDEQTLENTDAVIEKVSESRGYEKSEISIEGEEFVGNLISDLEGTDNLGELNQFLNEDHDHFKIDHGDQSQKVYHPGTAAGHIKYADERPGSHGLFDQSGEPVSLSELQHETSNHNGIVWRAVLSLKESDAVKLGYIEKEPWENMLRARVAEAANEMNIKESNLRWVAAYHAEEDHPHVHLAFWEKNPTRDRGMLSKGEIEDVKRVFMREIYAEERTRMHQEKTANRDLLRDFARGDLQDYVRILKEVKGNDLEVLLEQRAIGNVELGLAPKMYRADEKEIILSLQKVAEIMPKSGRIAFQYMDDDVKNATLLVVDKILSNAFTESMNGYMNAVEEQTLLHTNNPEKIELAKQNAYKDIQKRVANIVVGAAAEVNRTSYLVVDESAIKKGNEAFLTASGKPQQDLNEDIVKAVTGHLRLYDFKREDVDLVFENWIPKIHTDKNIEEVKKIVSAEFENDRAILPKVLERYVSDADVEFASKVTGKVLENPNDSVDYYSATLRSQIEMTHLMKTTIVPIESESEIDEIAVKLNAAMRGSGIGFKKRESLLNEWAENNEVNVDFKEVDSATRNDYDLEKNEWNELCGRLSLDPKSVSWNEKKEIVLSPAKTEGLYNELRSIKKIPKIEVEGFRELVEKIVPIVTKSVSSLNKELDHWNTVFPVTQRFTEEEKNALTTEWNRQDIKSIRTLSSMLTSAGFGENEILKKLSPIVNEEKRLGQISDYVRTVDVKLKQGLSIERDELNKIGELLKVESFKNPYKYNANYETTEENKDELMEVFRNARLPDKKEETVKSTSFWMNQTMIQSGVASAQRVEIMGQWAINNGVESTNEYQSLKIDSDKEFIVGKKKWSELCKVFELGELKVPWTNKSTLVLEKDKLEGVLEVITSKYPGSHGLENDDKIMIRDFMIKGFAISSDNQENFSYRLKNFNGNLPVSEKLDDGAIKERIQEWKRNDFEFVQKVLKVENQLEKTISDYSVVLKTFEMPNEDIKKAVTEWAERTSISIPNEKLNDLLDKTLKSFDDKKAWGQTPALSKETFSKLCENLNVKSPYLWKPTFTPSNGLLNGLWKKIFNAVEQEKQQGNAQAELQRRQIERDQHKKQRLLRQQDQGQER